MLVLPATTAQSSGCITILPIYMKIAHRGEMKDPGASITVIVQSKGPPLHRVRVGLYTFGGFQLGSKKVRAIRSGKEIEVPLKFPLPSKDFSLYAEGFPNGNPSCGPKHASRVVRKLRGGKKQDTGNDNGGTDNGGTDNGGTDNGGGGDQTVTPF